MSPKVTFVVPCYNYGRYLSECVESILPQTYSDFEVIIMDDASSDNTPEVARTLHDPRIHYLRNAENLAVAKNVNKGIALARGEYIWVISADDKLSDSSVLERYVETLGSHPSVGYIFCAAICLEEGEGKGIYPMEGYETRDAIFKGTEFLPNILRKNFISAPTVMARKDCYLQLGSYRQDLPNAHDWYLWCLFSLYRDVAYFHKPMVTYRRHHDSQWHTAWRRQRLRTKEEMMKAQWLILKWVEAKGPPGLLEVCRQVIAEEYSSHVAFYSLRKGPEKALRSFERFLLHHEQESQKLSSDILYRVKVLLPDSCHRLGDSFYARDRFSLSSLCYQRAFQMRKNLKVFMKYALLKLGWLGCTLRYLL